MKRWRDSREKLSGGDGRSIGCVAGVIEDAHAKPAIDALAAFALDDANLRSKVVPILEDLAQHGSPALQSRGCLLLKKLEKK